ncbi:MAG: hypothetical protein EOO77_32580 [Oxalobacteraceae bacterium]|nr:MAG: hypothetical protein EOO77_32580 [Oxalobacteraceae bacterium]
MSRRDHAQQVDGHSIYVGEWKEARYFTIWWSRGIGDAFIDLDRWLTENLGLPNGRWISENSWTRTNVVIRDPDDAIWFKMVWG